MMLAAAVALNGQAASLQCIPTRMASMPFSLLPVPLPMAYAPHAACNRDVAVLKRSGLILLDKMLR